MITIKTNIDIVTDKILKKLNILQDREYLLRPVAFDVVSLMTERIHQEGQASDGNQIGQYSNNYLKQRVKKYNRKEDKKIVVSLTRQLENDWSVIATERGYGIGFLNTFNLQKAGWVEEIKDKSIFKLTKREADYARDKLQQLITDAIHS